MNRAEVMWAAGHDWFVRSCWDNGLYGGCYGVVVRDEWSQAGRTTFYDYNELRRWAGY